MHGIYKHCPECDVEFLSRTIAQKFCSKECHHKYDENSKIVEFPRYICPDCKHESKLDFFPTQDSRKWLDYKCPWCLKENNRPHKRERTA